jgi:hypothetical protein
MNRHLEAEDTMKLLDKTIEMTKPVQALASSLKACAESLEKLASNLAIVARNQAVHHHMILQMWATHQVILRKLNEHSLDTSLPDGKKVEKAKPN